MIKVGRDPFGFNCVQTACLHKNTLNLLQGLSIMRLQHMHGDGNSNLGVCRMASASKAAAAVAVARRMRIECVTFANGDHKRTAIADPLLHFTAKKKTNGI